MIELVGLIGFGLAGLGCFIFCILFSITAQKNFTSKLFISSMFVLCLSAFFSAMQIYLGFSLLFILFFEAFKLFCISLLIMSFGLNVDSIKTFLKHPKILRFFFTFSVGLISLIAFITWSLDYSWLFIGLLAFNLYVLALLEQLYRNSTEKVRWSLWPLVIGIGAIVVFDFILYAQGALLNSLNFDFWFARGFILCMAIPFFILAGKRIKNLGDRLFVSREVVFYSSILLIAGSYLLLLSFAGYIISYLQADWSGILSVLFLAVGFLVFVAMLLTNKFRRKLKVFISKHFFSNKYEYRDEWLKVTMAIEQSHKGDIVENLCLVMANSIGVNDCAFLQVNQNNRLDIRHSSGLKFTQEHFDDLAKIQAFCQESRWIIDFNEYIRVPEQYNNLQVNGQLFLDSEFALIIPVFNLDELLGVFILPAAEHGHEINWEDRDFLFSVAKQVANYLFLHNAQTELAQSQQFNMFNRMSAFVVHDLKNIQAQLSLVSSNAEKHRDNPEFINDVFSTIKSADTRLNKVVMQLRDKAIDVSETTIERVNVFKLLSEIKSIRDQQKPIIKIECEHDFCLNTDKERLYSILMHLIQNAQDASEHSKIVVVRVTLDSRTNGDNRNMIEIKDQGIGMTSDFIKNELFKPFCSTKGNAGMGIGAFDAKQFVESQSGELKVQSQLGIGTTFTVILPVL